MTSSLRSTSIGTSGEAVVDITPNRFEEFYESNFRRVFTGLCLVTGDRHEAEEITQESFLRVFEHWDRVGALEDPTGYVFRVAMNVFRSRYRRAALAVRRALSLVPDQTDDLGRSRRTMR
jgi:RNA polymerase sigma-70 factor (ECF subfamily)